VSVTGTYLNCVLDSVDSNRDGLSESAPALYCASGEESTGGVIGETRTYLDCICDTSDPNQDGSCIVPAFNRVVRKKSAGICAAIAHLYCVRDPADWGRGVNTPRAADTVAITYRAPALDGAGINRAGMKIAGADQRSKRRATARFRTAL
jgi:hypothetical protein